MSCPTKHLKQYIKAEIVMALGALQFPQTWGPVPLEERNTPIQIYV